MSPNQAIGMILIACGIGIYCFLSQLWSQSKTDPRWVLRGEFREIGPGAVHVINAVILVGGGLTGAGSVLVGVFLLSQV